MKSFFLALALLGSTLAQGVVTATWDRAKNAIVLTNSTPVNQKDVLLYFRGGHAYPIRMPKNVCTRFVSGYVCTYANLAPGEAKLITLKQVPLTGILSYENIFSPITF